MPYPEEHACRLNDPSQYVRFARDNDKDPNLILGIKKGGGSELQAYRYPKGKWSAQKAKAHCQKHKGNFEAASKTADELGITIYDEGKELMLSLYGTIGDPDDGNTVKQITETLKGAAKVELITVTINSTGGGVFEGMAIYNALFRHPARVEVNIDGVAASIASVIAMAGDKISIARNAAMMIHDPTMFTGGRGDDLRKGADLLDKTVDMIVATYAARTKQDPDKIREMMAKETWMLADDALRLGFVDEIVAPKRLAAFADLAQFDKVPKEWLAAVLADQEATATAARPEHKETDMSSADVETVDMADIRAEGAKAEQVRFDALAEAFDDAAFVGEMFKGGKTPDDARPIWQERESKRLADENKGLTAENEGLKTATDDLRKKLEAAEAEIAKVKAEMEAAIADDCGDALTQPRTGADSGTDRMGVINGARKAFRSECEQSTVLTSEAAWVNMALRDADMEALTEQETKENGIRATS